MGSTMTAVDQSVDELVKIALTSNDDGDEPDHARLDGETVKVDGGGSAGFNECAQNR
jgi:hypothetical protein